MKLDRTSAAGGETPQLGADRWIATCRRNQAITAAFSRLPCTYIELKDAGHHISEWDDKAMKTILQTSVDFLGKAFV